MLDRRRFVIAAAAAPFAGAFAPEAVARLLAPAPRFRSRPSLDPPVVHVVTAPRGTAPGYIFVANANGAGQSGPMILDDDGELIWFSPRAGVTVMNFSAHTLGSDRILAWWEGAITGGHGSGEYVLAGSDYRELGRLRAGNGLAADFHEFSITPQKTAILTAYGPTSDGKLLDSVVQEIDVASGNVLFEWRASEHIALADSFVASGGAPIDFAHLNAAALDTDGAMLISSRHASAIFKVDRASGGTIWQLGGKKSDFTMGDGTTFWWQHHVRRHKDGSLTVFDNGAGPTVSEPFSRGLRLELDETKGTATLVQQVAHPDRLLASAMGSMEVVDDGGAFVGWGAVPRFSEFAPDGTLRFDAGYPGGGFTYRALRRTWTGHPMHGPTLAVATVGGKRSAFVSWNGATAVTRWRLLVGESKGSLTRGAVVAKEAFETRFPLRSGHGWVQVEALNGKGHVLGRTPAHGL